MKIWLRNVLFIAFCLAALGMMAGRVLERPKFSEPKTFSASAYENEDFRGVVNKVDDAFAAQWKAAGLEPTGRATDLAIARRLSLALTGTIPSFEEIQAFEKDPIEQRTQWWLAHLFEDRRCGDYLAERFARVLVGVEDGPFIIYRRRRLVNWLSDQIIANRPYDQIVRQMITAEGIWTTKPEVNFITVTVDQNNKEEGPDEMKLGGRVAKAFLGVRLDCVQCHDDFMGGKWKQKDFHELAAFFVQSEMSMTGVRDNPEKHYEVRFHGKNKLEPVLAKAPFKEELMPADGALRERLAAWVTHPENRAFARTLVNRAWALLFNRPLHAPVDSIPLEGPWPAGMEILADDLIAHHFDLQRLMRMIAATRAFQLESRSRDVEHPVTPEQEKVFAAFPLTRLRPEQMAGSLLQSAKLKTIDANSHVLVRVIRYFEQNDFVKRYGDAGEDEFGMTGGTIPQRLIMMNGKLVQERTKEDLLMNSATRIAAVAPNNDAALESAFLTVLTRRPTADEKTYFEGRWARDDKRKSAAKMTDLFWTLINSTEFSWNH
jgi:hypothetical protein